MSDAAPRVAKHQPDAVADYLREKGWATKLDRKGENIQVEFCPFCGNDRYNFEIHKDKGCFSCWACDEKGGFRKLKEKMGDAPAVTKFSGKRDDATSRSSEDRGGVAGSKGLDVDKLTESIVAVHARIWERPAALAYLRQRGFTDETIAHFKLGTVKQEGVRWVTIPHMEGDKCVNVKYRTMPGEGDTRWKSHPGGRKVLFNGAALREFKEIIIVEGELKAAACWQMGFRNVVGLTHGVKNFFPTWVDQIEHLDKIWLCLDNDKDGQRNAEIYANRFGLDRCYNVVLPDAKDPDEYFFEKGHDAADFQTLLDKARRYEVKSLVSLQDALWQLRDEVAGRTDEPPALMTPWRDVNKLTKGLRPGELIILSAPPKIGKTTFALNLSYFQATTNHVPVLFYCVEMGPKRLARKIVCLDNQVDEDFFDEDLVAETALRMMHKPFYLPERVRSLDLDTILETCRAAYKRYGIKLLVFDNLHFLVRSADNQRELLGVASQAFKLLAEELQIPVILVVHPRKLKRSAVAMTSDDLKDTSALHADADMVVVLHRKRVNDENPDGDADDGGDDGGDAPETTEQLFMPETQVIVDASRYTAGGKTWLYYEGAESRFRTIDADERRGGSVIGT